MINVCVCVALNKMAYQYDRFGQPYIVAATVDKDIVIVPLGVFCSLDDIERRYGAGMRLYFSFVKFVFCSNILLCICGVIGWSIFLADPNKPSGFLWTDFFVSSYLQSNYWFWPNIVIFISLWLVVPAYFLWERYAFKRIIPKEKLEQNDVILENLHFTANYYWAIGATATLCALGIASAVFYGLIEAQRYVSTSVEANNVIVFNLTANSLMSIPVSLSFVICNAVWDKVSFFVTQREHNRTWFRFRLSQALKLIVFKVATATVLYAMIATLLPSGSGCLMQNSGINFVVSIFIDIILITVVLQTCIPTLWSYYLSKRSDPNPKRTEFDLSEQLLLLLYRQFLLYISVLVVPPIGVLGLIALCIQYPLDKWKLTTLCKQYSPPRLMQESPGLWLLSFMLFITLAAFLTYPNGALWMLFVPKALPVGFQNCSVIKL